MISFLFSLILMFFLNCSFMNNPVKMKMSLMFSSFVILVMMKSLNTSSWLPLIYAMLYLGGILMMFMILSSFLPNSKMGALSKKKILFVMSIFMLSLPNGMIFSCQSSNLKAFLEDKINLIFMTSWILMVFFGFILMLSECRLSMRTLF